MKATRVVVHQAGHYDQLSVERVSIPTPGPDDVVVRADACGVNYADCIVRMGLYESAKKYVGWPITPGFEVAGSIESLGSAVTGFSVGDRVVAVTRFGGYTSHLCLSASQVFALPESLSTQTAAALPTVFLTAWYALFELAHPRPGQHALVHSAAGGVGGALVQLLKRAGCRVTGVVGRTHKVATARDLGADDVIDGSRQKLWRAAERLAPDGFDLVFDANGVATLGDSYKHLSKPGKLVIYGFHTMLPHGGRRINWLKLALGYLRTPRFNPLAMTGDNRGVLAFNLSYLFEQQALLTEGMTLILSLFGSGELVAPPIATYPLEEVARAHQALESRQTVGKLVLLP